MFENTLLFMVRDLWVMPWRSLFLLIWRSVFVSLSAK